MVAVWFYFLAFITRLWFSVLWALGFRYVGRMGLEVCQAVLALLLKLFLSTNTCTRRVSIGKAMGSRANRPIVNTGILMGKAAGKIVASISKGFGISTSGGNMLMVDFINCIARRMPITRGRVMVILGRSARLLSRIIMLKCNTGAHGRSLSTSINMMDGARRLTTHPMASARNVLRKRLTNIAVATSNNSPASSPGVIVHNRNSRSKSGML